MQKGFIRLYINGKSVGTLDMPRFNWGGDEEWRTSGTHYSNGYYTP